MSHTGTDAFVDPSRAMPGDIPPAWFKPIRDCLDPLLIKDGGDVFKACLHPKPLQMFFAEYLQRDLPSFIQNYFENEKRYMFSNNIAVSLQDDLARKHFLEFSPPVAARQPKVIAMTKDQYKEAIPGILHPHVRGTADVLQRGTDTYFSQLDELLTHTYPDIHAKNGAVTTSISFQSFRQEFLPFIASSYVRHNNTDHPFSTAFDMAATNDAFMSKMMDNPIRKCPAQSLIRHLLNTDFIPQADGSLIAAKNPRDGALLSYIYNKFVEYDQAARVTVTKQWNAPKNG